MLSRIILLTTALALSDLFFQGTVLCNQKQSLKNIVHSTKPSEFSSDKSYLKAELGIHGSHSTQFNEFEKNMGWGMGQQANTQYLNWANHHLYALNIHWSRSATISWDTVEPELGGPYNWTAPDEILKALYKENQPINDVVLFWEGQRENQRDPLDYPEEFKQFVQKVVERYDGDGIDDVPSHNPVSVKYWQAGNEYPGWAHGGRSREEYVEFFKLLAEGAQTADPEAKIVLIAEMPSSDLDSWWKQTVLDLKGILAVTDFHDWGKGKASRWKDFIHLENARQFLDNNGMADVEIWSLENATHTGHPETPAWWAPYSYQTLKEQARFMVKRICWARAHGLDKFFWSFLIDNNSFNGQKDNFYNSIALIGDGKNNQEPVPDGGKNGFNERRAIYWTLKLLSEYTDTPSASEIGEMNLTNEELKRWGFEYQLNRNGKHVYVLWTEGEKQEVTFNVSSSAVTVIDMVDVSEQGVFNNYYNLNVNNDQVTLPVGKNPLMVIEIDKPDGALPSVSFTAHKNEIIKNVPGPDIPYYFLAIHNEPSQGKILASQYQILRNYIKTADKYNIKLTLMFTTPWIQYISSSKARIKEVRGWQKKGHEISSHHHEYYHFGFDGYSRYSESEVKKKRDKAGLAPKPYRGTIDDYSKIILSFDPNIQSGCPNEEPDKSTMPDFVRYSTCSGLSNSGTPENKHFTNRAQKAVNDYIIVGEVNGIERKWLSHFLFHKDMKASIDTFQSMNGKQVFGGVVHSTYNAGQDNATIQFIEFLGQIDPAGTRSKTVSEIIEERLLPQKRVSKTLLQRIDTEKAPNIRKNIFSKKNKGRCGDKICDNHEKFKPGLCPQDCTIHTKESEQHIKGLEK